MNVQWKSRCNLHNVQPTVLKTNRDNVFIEREGDECFLAKLKERICGLMLLMEKMLDSKEYCSSNLNLFHSQIDICQPVIFVFKELNKNYAFLLLRSYFLVLISELQFPSCMN